MVVPHGVYDPRNVVFGTFLISFSLGLNRFCQIVFENKLCKVRGKTPKSSKSMKFQSIWPVRGTKWSLWATQSLSDLFLELAHELQSHTTTQNWSWWWSLNLSKIVWNRSGEVLSAKFLAFFKPSIALLEAVREVVRESVVHFLICEVLRYM